MLKVKGWVNEMGKTVAIIILAALVIILSLLLWVSYDSRGRIFTVIGELRDQLSRLGETGGRIKGAKAAVTNSLDTLVGIGDRQRSLTERLREQYNYLREVWRQHITDNTNNGG